MLEDFATAFTAIFVMIDLIGLTPMFAALMDEYYAPDPSVFPLATPLIAGPGSFAAIILLASEHQGDFGKQSVVHLASFAVCFVAVLLTAMIERVLGQTGIKVLSRLFGLLLGALAVQFILDGATEYWSSALL